MRIELDRRTDYRTAFYISLLLFHLITPSENHSYYSYSVSELTSDIL